MILYWSLRDISCFSTCFPLQTVQRSVEVHHSWRWWWLPREQFSRAADTNEVLQIKNRFAHHYVAKLQRRLNSAILKRGNGIITWNQEAFKCWIVGLFIFWIKWYKINDFGSVFLRSADEHVWIKSIFEHRDYQSNSLECIYKNKSCNSILVKPHQEIIFLRAENFLIIMFWLQNEGKYHSQINVSGSFQWSLRKG